MPFIVFDLDGTLIDCAERQCALLAFALSELSLPAVDLVDVWALKRRGYTTRDALIDRGVPEEGASRAAELWRRHIEDVAWLRRDRVLDGALAALSLCKERGASLALLTARSRPDHLAQQLDWLGLSPCFEEVRVVPPLDVVARKAACLRELSARGFVGDTESDADAAAVAEVPFMAVSTGQRSPDFLRAKGVRSIVEGAREAALYLLDPAAMPSA